MRFSNCYCFIGSSGRKGLVSELFQHPFCHHEHGFFVLCNEHRLAPSLRDFLFRPHPLPATFFRMHGKIYLKCGPYAGFAIDVYETVILIDYPVNGRKAQAGSPSGLFGCEKGLEDLGKGFLIHAAAVVAYRKQNEITLLESFMPCTVFFIKGHIPGLYRYLSSLRQGIPGVYTQVCKYLIYLGRIHHHSPEIDLWSPCQLNVFTNKPSEHLEHPVYGLINAKKPWGKGLPSCKGKKLPHYLSRALARCPNLF